MKLTRWRLLLLVALLAAVPRIIRLLFNEVMEGDGCEYCRLAERLLAGEGYRGMLPGPERMFPPGAAVMIAGVMKLFSVTSETAARGVSFVSGVALPPLLVLITERYATRRAALITGVLAALLPGFILSSAATYCEAPQLTFFAGAMLLLMSAAEKRSMLPAAFAGALFAFSYLTRAESFAPGLLAGLLLFLGPGRVSTLRRRVGPAFVFFVVFLSLSLPYPLLLLETTGEFRLEGKSERVIATVENYAHDVPYLEANYALPVEGRRGPWLDPNEPWDGPSKGEIFARSGAEIAFRTLKQAMKVMLLYLSGHSMGSLLFLLLLPLALRGPHPRGRLLLDLWFLGIAAYFVAATAFYKPVLRYLLPLGIMGVVWAGRAVDHLLSTRWKRVPEDGLGRPGWILILALLLSTGRGLITGVREFGDSHTIHRPAREVGARLRDSGVRGRIMGDDTRIAFYAKREWTPVPVAETPALLRQRIVDLDVGLLTLKIEEGGRPERPGAWFDPDAPPPPLVPLFSHGPYRVYRCR